MGVKKQMDTFFASLGEQTGYRGRLVNTPMGPFRWNDAIELWENVNNGMVMNNISFMDEFAMMDYDTLGGGGGESRLITAILDLNFMLGSLDPRITFRRTTPASYINASGNLAWADTNLVPDSATIGSTFWFSDPNWVAGSTFYVSDPFGTTTGFNFSVTPAQFAAVRTLTSASFDPEIISGITHTQKYWIKGDTGAQARFVVTGAATGSTAYMTIVKGSTTGSPVSFITSNPSGVANLDISSDILYSSTAWTEIELKIRAEGYNPSNSAVLCYLAAVSAPVGITKTHQVAGLMIYPGEENIPYIPTYGLPYSAPRFDYSLTGATLGLLIEPDVTNVALSLQTAAGWGRNNTNYNPPTFSTRTRPAYTELGPDNRLSGSVFVSTTGSLSAQPASSIVFGTSQTANRTFSTWLKGWSGNTVAAFGIYGSAGQIPFNVVDTTIFGPGTLGGISSGSIFSGGSFYTFASVLGLSNTAWTRVSMSVSGTGFVGSDNYAVFPIGLTNYSGSVERGVVVAYPQVEAGLRATSTTYPRDHAATHIKRQDIVSIQGSSFASWFKQNNDGTVIATVIPGLTATSQINNYVWSINNATATNSIRQIKGVTSNNLLSNYIINSAGFTIPTLNNVFVPNTINKIAMAWSVGTGGLFVTANGQGGTSGNLIGATYPTGLTRMSIGVAETLSGNNFNGWIQRIQYFDQKLSESDIQSRTV
jgi:hypothetical protein